MADTKFQVDETVLVPASQMPNPNAVPFGLVKRIVRDQTDRSVCVDDGLGGTVEVASRLVHSIHLGISVVRIGDLGTEAKLLDPLAKSVVQFLRLLVDDPDLRYVSLRTLAELEAHWTSTHAGTSHVVLIGHANDSKLSFVDVPSITGKDLAGRLDDLTPETPPKTVVSLACKTGLAGFAKPFSQGDFCRDFIGPMHEIPGAAASQFCQALLSEHLLDGVEIPWAFRRAGQRVVGGRPFWRWRDGKRHVARAT